MPVVKVPAEQCQRYQAKGESNRRADPAPAARGSFTRRTITQLLESGCETAAVFAREFPVDHATGQTHG